MFTPEISLPSFAKINLSLRVLGKRPDGFHEVETILQTVSLYDELQFGSRNDQQLMLHCGAAEVPHDSSNLIIRAAQLLRETYNLSFGAEIHLQKRIPTRGGLGGASSNAAVALLGLGRLWGVELDQARLIELGRNLGADVPYFFLGGRVLATGMGTDLLPLPDISPLALLIVKPEAGVLTADAYQALRATALTTANTDSILPSSRLQEILSNSDQWPLHNDFESVIFEIEPEIERVRRALLKAGAQEVLLAGSGSSVFGIFDGVESQQRALRQFETEAGWRLFSCETLSRCEYVRALGFNGSAVSSSSWHVLDSGA